MAVVDRLLSEVDRQQKYLSKLPPEFAFPLFNAKVALESQRASGYRSTAAAGREIVDNALEAGADWVHVLFDVRRSGGRNQQIVSSVAFIDNGAGMLPKMARYALSWGGGTHFDDPSEIGRFGFGLPNSSINRVSRSQVRQATMISSSLSSFASVRTSAPSSSSRLRIRSIVKTGSA